MTTCAAYRCTAESTTVRIDDDGSDVALCAAHAAASDAFNADARTRPPTPAEAAEMRAENAHESRVS